MPFWYDQDDTVRIRYCARVAVFRNECLTAPALQAGSPLPFLAVDQFWPSIVFNPAAASAFLFGLPWHQHQNRLHAAAQPPSVSPPPPQPPPLPPPQLSPSQPQPAQPSLSSYQSSVIHKALSERMLAASQWPTAVAAAAAAAAVTATANTLQTSSSEPHSPSSGSSSSCSPAPPSPIAQELFTASESRSPDRDCSPPPPPVFPENVPC